MSYTVSLALPWQRGARRGPPGLSSLPVVVSNLDSRGPGTVCREPCAWPHLRLSPLLEGTLAGPAGRAASVRGSSAFGWSGAEPGWNQACRSLGPSVFPLKGPADFRQVLSRTGP